jgi:hypothetical protein
MLSLTQLVAKSHAFKCLYFLGVETRVTWQGVAKCSPFEPLWCWISWQYDTNINLLIPSSNLLKQFFTIIKFILYHLRNCTHHCLSGWRTSVTHVLYFFLQFLVTTFPCNLVSVSSIKIQLLRMEAYVHDKKIVKGKTTIRFGCFERFN